MGGLVEYPVKMAVCEALGHVVATVGYDWLTRVVCDALWEVVVVVAPSGCWVVRMLCLHDVQSMSIII